MGRIIVIEPDPRLQQALGRLLHGTGHTVEMHADEASALGELAARPADLLLAAAGPGASLARRTWSALEELEPRPPVVWTAPLRAALLPLVEAGRGVDVLETPIQRPALAGLLARLLGGPRPEDRWSGRDFLGRVDGDAGRFPPSRVLFLAHRVGGTGTLQVQEPAGAWSVSLRGGRIVGAAGLAGLDAEAGPRVAAAAPPLMTWLGQLIAAGVSPDEAMRRAGIGIALAAIRVADRGGATVRFIDEPPAGAPVQLPTPIPRLLAEANRRLHGAAAVRRRLGGRRKDAVRVQPPDDAPESQWGLPPVALRLLRDGVRVGTLGELLGQARGGETDEVWEAVDLLLCLGLLAVDGAVAGPGPARPPEPEDDIEIEAIVEPPPAAGGDDPAAGELRAALHALKRQPPWEVLALEDSEAVEPDGIEAAFRRRSAAFHPDRFLQAGPAAQRLAEQCFGLVGEAREAFEDEAFMLETRQRLKAAEEGRPFATEEEKRRARLSIKRGEVATRRKQWAEAFRLFGEAASLDPTDPAHEWRRLESGWRAGELDGDATALALEALAGLTIGQRAEVLALVGEIRLRAGDEAAAFAAFERVVEMKPDHIEARRHLRLRDMRAARTVEAPRKGLSLKGLFSFGRNGGSSTPESDA